MTTGFTIDRGAVDEMIAHAREDAPNECCGLLVGTGTSITAAWRARNLHASPVRYLIDPRDQFAALKAARAAGHAVIGAYHSHPASAPLPSPTDEREATYSDYLYVIVSLADPENPELRAYRPVIEAGTASPSAPMRLLPVALVVGPDERP